MGCCSGIKWNDTRGARAAHVIVRRAVAQKDHRLQFQRKLDW
jgi:hypothetical protein